MNKKYRIILADPPWRYGNTKNIRGSFWGINERHYPTMKLADIKKLSVSQVADKNCYLFLWITSPFLEKGFEVIKAWGFKYCTVGFVWIKMKNDMSKIRQDGLGKYTISNAEYCLIARKGKYHRKAKNVQQIIQLPKGRHSQKPNEVKKRIVCLFGDLPRIELFAREKTEGWHVWGNEIESDIELTETREQEKK